MTSAQSWWAPAVTMAERVAARQPLPSAGSAHASRSTGAAGPLPATSATSDAPDAPDAPDAKAADGRPAAEVDPVAAWRADYPSAALFRERLAELGLDDDGLRALLTEPPGALAARVRRPSWAATAERALAAAPHDPPHVPHPLSWDAGFARILAPFTEIAADRMVRRAMRADRDEVADMPAVRHCFTDQLSARLVLLARRTLVLHLNVARVSGGLAGATPEQRFADFVRRCSARPGLRALLTEYPVLARLLAQTCEQSVEAWGEVLARLAEDRPALVGAVFEGKDPGLLGGVSYGAGDQHQGGRSVAVLRFAGGARVVLKPRPVGVHRHFNDVLHWLGSHLPGLSPRALRVLERPGYGWVEYVTAAPCTDRAEVARFYWRTGALLALVHGLGGTDLHAENLIACADQPIPVDLETLLHPVAARPNAADPALAALESSVRRTALLPSFVVGEQGALDLSALGGDRDNPLPNEVTGWASPATDEMRLIRTPGVFRGAANRPRLGGEDADPGEYADDLIAGFRAGYDTIAAHRAELAGSSGLLAGFADTGTRAVLRHTRWYAALLDESLHPDVLRDAPSRDRLLDILWRESATDPVLRPLVGAELAELWAGDVPLISCRPGSAVLTVGGLNARGLITETGLSYAERQLSAMSGTDRLDQEWVIRAALATRRPAPGHNPAASNTSAAPGGSPAEDQPSSADDDAAEHRTPCAVLGNGGAATGRSPAQEEPGESAAPHGRPAECPAPAAARNAVGFGAAVVADPERLLSAACGIADRILAAAQDNGRRVNWLGLEPLDERVWAVMPQGAGLPHGYCGTALFLAQLADLAGIERYVEVARRALTPVPGLLALLGEDPGDVMAVGAGLAGLGGIAYALGRLSVLLDDRRIAEWAAAAVELAALAAEFSEDPGVLEGDAGCLAAMLAVQEITGSPQAAATARLCADRLAALEPQELPYGGFDRGAAGIGWALLRFAADGGNAWHAEAGRAALRTAAARYTAAPLGAGWCDGPSGTALAVADSAGAGALPEAAALLARAVAADPVAGDHSLCHGETGALDLLLTATAAGRTGPGALHHRAGALLAALDRFGPRCGTPDAVGSPGLLTGMAGIGYGLLRLGFGARVPSVLLLKPPGA